MVPGTQVNRLRARYGRGILNMAGAPLHDAIVQCSQLVPVKDTKPIITSKRCHLYPDMAQQAHPIAFGNPLIRRQANTSTLATTLACKLMQEHHTLQKCDLFGCIGLQHIIPAIIMGPGSAIQKPARVEQGVPVEGCQGSNIVRASMVEGCQGSNNITQCDLIKFL